MSWTTIGRDLKKHRNGWLLLSLIGAAVVLLPLLPIILSLFQAPNENWLHIKEYLLKSYVFQSFWLVLFTSIFTVLLAVPLAWLIAAYDFPLRGFFRWALMLPLAIPPYIAAYTYSTMFSYTGVVQTTLRSTFGITPNPNTFGVMSMQGAVFVFTLFLFPYIYIVTKSYLERQSGSYVESAILLGRGPISVFTRIVLPLSRPAVIGGVMLVIFEVLSDYGVTNFFGVQTISNAIFRTWFGMYDIDSAVRLAAWLMVGIIGLFILERLLRRNRRFSSARSRPLARRRLTGIYGFTAFLFAGLVFAWSFLIPVTQLIVWASWTYADVLTPSFWRLTYNTLTMALTATAIVMFFAVVVANVNRIHANPFSQALSRVVTAGYSIPGAIVAMGVLVVFVWTDRQLAPLYARMGLGENPLVLSLSLVMLVMAYVVRFMATGYNAVDAGFAKVGTKYLEVSRSLGHGITATFFKVDLPLMKGAILSGTILTFVEIVKELPLALLLRPFNFETLATKAYQYASDEQIHQAAVPSLFIIGLSMLSVFLLNRLGRGTNR